MKERRLRLRNFASVLQEQYEALDPKAFMRRITDKKIWPSENYYLNIWKDGKRWQDGEFCPGQVNEKNEFMAFDGMYGLVDDVYQAIGLHGDNPTPAQEEQFEQAMDVYDTAFFSSIKQGVTSGTVDGVAGRYHWQLVYDPSSDKEEREINRTPFNSWAEQVRPVKPGQSYGTRITPKTDRSQWRAFGGTVDPMAEALVNAILDGEDPKRFLAQLKKNEKAVVDLYHYDRSWPDSNRKLLGRLAISLDGSEHPTSEIKGLEPEVLRFIYRQLRRGTLNGEVTERQVPGLGEKRYYFHLSGTQSVGRSSHAVGNFADKNQPFLVVETPEWQIRFPLYVDDNFGSFTWRPSQAATPLTPEQSAFMDEHGEFIFLGMNEGDEFEGTIHSYAHTDDETDGEETTVGKWWVEGNPGLAPEGPMGDEGYG